MAVTQADVDALNQMLADGVRSVTLRGQTTIYNTTDSLIKARDDLVRQLARQEAAGKPRSVTYIHHAGRGY